MIYSLVLIALAGLLLNYISEKYVFSKFEYYRAISKNVVEVNDEIEITEIIENKKKMPVTFLQTVSKYPGNMEIKLRNNSSIRSNQKSECIYYTTTSSIMSNQRVKRVYRVSFIRRGRYLFDEVNINAGDILGLKVINKLIYMPSEVVVLPQRYSLEDNIAVYGDYYGEISVKRWIIDDPVLTVGIREYTGLEPQKTIHWPSSLKTGKLMVRNFDYTTDNRVLILLNIESTKPFWFSIEYEKIEKCISIARTIVEDYNELGIPFGFGTNALIAGFSNDDSQINSGWGETHLSDILEQLGRIEYSINSEFEEYIDKINRANDTYTTCIIISPNINELYIEKINRMSLKFSKTVVISIDSKNLDMLNPDIITLAEGCVNS